jgi:hypothetical protein
MSRPVFKKVLFTSAALFLLASAAPAQRVEPLPSMPDASVRGPGQRPRPMGSPEEEIIKRAEIKRDEENHEEMVERADEAARLGADLRAAFDRQKTFSREDLKRLEKMEKLARKIRGNAGGSDDEEQLKDPPSKLDEAVTRLAAVSIKLNESVRKTTRHVVSGTVIERSNELIELVRHVRSFFDKP